MNVVTKSNNRFPWYAAGLHFECLKCGRCCSGPAEGYIWVNRSEIRLIAGCLNMSVKEVKEKYLSRVGFKMTINEDIHTHDCIFLRNNGQGKVCTIYPVRPAQCRSWPFWPSNLAGPQSWNIANQRCPGINRGQFYSPEQIQTRQNTKHWWRPEKNKELIQGVEDIYKWLDEQLAGQNGNCTACGKCCDFQSFGHRLFITTPEMIFFSEKMGIKFLKSFIERPDCHFDRSDALRRGVEKSIKKDSSTSLSCARNDIEMSTGRCPYQTDDKCTVYPYRFAGCRIFFCKGNADFQSDLTEAVIKKFKSLCEEFEVPYRYADLPTALNL